MLRPLLSFRSRPMVPDQSDAGNSRSTGLHLIVSALILTLVLSAIMAVPIIPGQVQVEEGLPAAQDVYSTSPFRYESKVLTEKARADAVADKANEVWLQDAVVVQRQRSMLLHNLGVVDHLRNADLLDPQGDDLPQITFQGITPTQILTTSLLNISEKEYRYWRDSVVVPAFDTLMRERRMSTDGDVQAARASLPSVIATTLSADEKAAAVEFIAPLLRVNVTLDKEQTKQRQDNAAASIKPVIVTVQKGEAILRQGEIATSEGMEKMREAGLLSREISLQTVLGATSIAGLLMLLLHLYIFRHESQVGKRRKQLILVGMLLVVTVLSGRLFLPGHSFLPYLLPLAAVSMLLAVLLSPNLAMLVTFILSVLLGMVVNSGLTMDLPVYYFISGLTGIFTLTRIEKVSTFAIAGGGIAVASFLAAVTMRLVGGNPVDWDVAGQLALAALFNAGISTSITYAAFSLLGTLFGITTPLQLMELAHPDQPILRRLMREAPGTYHHSLVVGNLAERAAETIGCDPLLTRVCAYYHDIGKVERPFYFIDNQSGMANIHDELDPYASAAIIAEHVRDGMRLGRKYKVPRRVLDAIPQHHGTMLIKYFYHKAQQANPDANPDDFRYPGPKPQTKENAILMLADGVEATVRAMAQSGALDKMTSSNSDATEGAGLYNDTSSLPEDAIARVVHKTISERIEDGQLDECDLTVRDIARIQEAFVSMLKGIYHPRVSYPEATRPNAVPVSASNGQSAVPAANGHSRTAVGTEPLSEHKASTADVS
ncbi:MAG TPA: HDIG domain-containing protein [Chloroflexia bacterium]|nr:HDIG domain-containing protein [Chloroflexia bacterium]